MNTKTTKIGREAALALYESKWWVGNDAKTIATFQLLTAELCMPFDIFHESIEKAIGRPVCTHELALNHDGIVMELFGEADPPTFDEILALIPKEKLIVVTT